LWSYKEESKDWETTLLRTVNIESEIVLDFFSGADIIIVTEGLKATVYKGFEVSRKSYN
jgi:hypothetical protein